MCFGCLRTLDEIEQWVDMSDNERLAILEDIKTRILKE